MLKIAYNLLFHYQLFRPTAIIEHVSQIKQIADKEQLNYFVFDKDDTLVPVYQFNVQDKKIHDMLMYLHDTARSIVVVSNSVIVDEKNEPPEIRLNNGQKLFDILLTTSPKPFNGGQIQDLFKVQRTLNPAKLPFHKNQVAIVGDRLLTDILLGNLMGWKSYLVKPLEKTTIEKHGIGVYIMRNFQNFLIRQSNFPRYKPNQSLSSQERQQK